MSWILVFFIGALLIIQQVSVHYLHNNLRKLSVQLAPETLKLLSWSVSLARIRREHTALIKKHSGFVSPIYKLCIYSCSSSSKLGRVGCIFSTETPFNVDLHLISRRSPI